MLQQINNHFVSEIKQLFASKYLSYLPTEEELVAEIERQKTLLKLQDIDNRNS